MRKPFADLSFSFAEFAEGFDEHIQKSIRGYTDLLSDCVAMSEYFVEDNTTVFDIGCSTGNFLAHVVERNQERAPKAQYVGIDIEASFGKHWEQLEERGAKLHVADIRSFPIPANCSLVTSIFSLQFIPENARQNILDQTYRALLPGGALIVAEKTLAKCPKLHDMLTFIYYDYKCHHFSEAEVLRKERSLRSSMKLWSENQIIRSLVTAGFEEGNVQSFWRSHSFAAFIALRSSGEDQCSCR